MSTSNRRSAPASNASASSNAGVLFLFGGLLAVVAVVAAFAIPSMTRNKPQPIVVNNPLIASPPNPDASPTALPNVPLSNEPVNQNLSLEANREALVIPSKMGGNGTHTYTLQARSGQILNVGLTGNGMVMNVLNSQGLALPDGANIVNGDVAIAADGVYTVQLRGITNANELPYQLRLALKDKNAIASPNPISTPLPFNSPLPNNPPINPPVSPNPVPNATTPPPVAPTPIATPAPTTPAPQIEIKVRNR
jgi:serine/threonine-protein kinase